jgi:hypothetical protein
LFRLQLFERSRIRHPAIKFGYSPCDTANSNYKAFRKLPFALKAPNGRRGKSRPRDDLGE